MKQKHEPLRYAPSKLKITKCHSYNRTCKNGKKTNSRGTKSTSSHVCSCTIVEVEPLLKLCGSTGSDSTLGSVVPPEATLVWLGPIEAVAQLSLEDNTTIKRSNTHSWDSITNIKNVMVPPPPTKSTPLGTDHGLIALLYWVAIFPDAMSPINPL